MEDQLAAICVQYLEKGCRLSFVVVPGQACTAPVTLFQLANLLKAPDVEITHDPHLCGDACVIPALYHYLLRTTPVHTALYLHPVDARGAARAQFFTAVAADATVATAAGAWQALLADPAAQVHAVAAACECPARDYAIVCGDARHAAHVNAEGHEVLWPPASVRSVTTALICLRCVTCIHDLYKLWFSVERSLTVIYRPPTRIPWVVLQLWRKEEARLFMDRGRSNLFIQATHHGLDLREDGV